MTTFAREKLDLRKGIHLSRVPRIAHMPALHAMVETRMTRYSDKPAEASVMIRNIRTKNSTAWKGEKSKRFIRSEVSESTHLGFSRTQYLTLTPCMVFVRKGMYDSMSPPLPASNFSLRSSSRMADAAPYGNSKRDGDEGVSMFERRCVGF